MTSGDFDSEEAKRFLQEKESKEKEEQEEIRTALLQRVTAILKEEFKDTAVEIYLVGSIVRPFAFSSRSDIDIVLKYYQGDRFDLWTKLEKKIGRDVEIILFETCHFQEFIQKEGFRVM